MWYVMDLNKALFLKKLTAQIEKKSSILGASHTLMCMQFTGGFVKIQIRIHRSRMELKTWHLCLDHT